MTQHFPEPPWHAPLSRRLTRIQVGLPTVFLCAVACAAALVHHNLPLNGSTAQQQPAIVPVVAIQQIQQSPFADRHGDGDHRGHH